MQHDMVINNGAGDPVRLDMQAALQALATCSSGAAAPATTYPGQFWLDTSVPPNGFLRQRNQANTAWQTVAGIPAKASAAEVLAGLDDSKFLTPAGLAAKHQMLGVARNRLVNPAMQISQQLGDTATPNAIAYIADQWQVVTNVVMSSGRVVSMTPRKSPRRLRMTVTTAKPVLASGDQVLFQQLIEGLRFADFAWGAAGARQVIARFGFRAPAGTYALSLRNAALNQCYVKNFTISAAQANIDTEQVFVIPGTAAGTWVVDNTLALYFGVICGAGSALIASPEGWASSNRYGAPGLNSTFPTVGAVFELFDVGLYLDLDGSGIPPRWSFPDEAAELLACQRYYVWSYLIYSNNVSGANNWLTGACLPTDLRAAPTFGTVSNNGQSANFPASGGYDLLMPRFLRESRLATGAGTGSFFSTVIEVNARM